MVTIKNLIIITSFLLLLPLLSACGSSHGTLVPSGALPAPAVEAADDIVFTPGGGVYRANVHEEGVENPWTPVPVATAYWTVGGDTISVLYRPDIETKAGETHNDIILVSGEEGLVPATHELKLYTESLPDGINIVDSHAAVGRPGVAGTVLVITVSPGIAPGEYSIDIGIDFDGKYYGTIPCKITVIE
jgi:hypothetical protein